MNKAQAEAICGTLSQTSKMPGRSISLPPSSCITGSALCKKKGSVCFSCYARKGNYLWPNVQKAMQTRLLGLVNPQWSEAMAYLIEGDRYFRFHDAGDLQGVWHLEKITYVARFLPKTRFWLPTKEPGIVSLLEAPIPDNLCIRVSAAMMDSRPTRSMIRRWPTSTVFTQKPSPALTPAGTRVCGATAENGCGSCRKCWNRSIANIAYKAH